MASPITSFRVTKRDDQEVNEVIVGDETEFQNESQEEETDPDRTEQEGEESGDEQESSEGDEDEFDGDEDVEETDEEDDESGDDGDNEDGEDESDEEDDEEDAEGAETPAPSIDDVISEKTSGKYKTLDTLLGAVEDLQKQMNDNPIKDDYIKKIVEYYNSTGTLEPVLKALSTDYNKMSDIQVMKADLRDKYPNLSDKAFNKIYHKEVVEKYNLDEDEYDPDDVEIGKELLKHEASKLRDAKIKSQQEFKVPEKKQASEDQKPDPEKYRQQVAKIKQSIEADPFVKEMLTSKRIAMKHGEGAFNFGVDKPEDLIQMVLDDNKFWQLFAKDGKVDYQKFMKVAAYAKDAETFEKSLIQYGKSLGKDAITKKLKNRKPVKSGRKKGKDKKPTGRLGLINAFAEKGVVSSNR